ncbi:T9SS-dependent choice-of-anchor J family protein [Nitritalea halalkaliphila]|uniref:T9SS-dependent choice-of-anchor J family protein n=1 Tax=Nitritalea halalkaliphila TaxID=590849 RepID=UPI0002EFD369|nr:choice-of-anchor J domain-containing protein [Nitritalea halalkaliphila]
MILRLPYVFDFEDLESGLWQIVNPDEAITWIDTVVTLDGTPTRMFKMNNFEYDARGQEDFIISPQIDLAAFPNAQLTFNMAHGPFPGAQFADELIVAISQDCGNNFDLAGAPFFKNETFLQTVAPAESPFIPISAGQFRREIVNLAPFASLGKVRIAIINRNGFGNNIFIKDLEILAEEQFRYAMRITELVAPNPIAAPGGNGNEVLAVENTGNLPISGFLLERQVTNNPRQTFIVRGQALPVGGVNLLNLPLSPTIEGTNSFRYQLLNPNFDQNPAPAINFQQFSIFSSTTMDTPWRQNFNGSVALAPWLTVNPERNNVVWRIEPSPVGDGENQLVLRNTRDGDSYWVGSPLFDLSQARFASLFFRRGAGPVDLNTRLRVLISRDGGLNYEPLLELDGETLSTTTSELPNRNTPGEFVREFINLNDFTGGNNNRLRVAFALESANEDNPPIFLDDIELFLSDNPNPVDPGINSTRLYPNPARDVFNLAFNFRNFEDVFVQVVSTTGQVVYEQSFPNTLNQTYSFTTALFSKGVFVVKVTSRSLSETKKLIIQ